MKLIYKIMIIWGSVFLFYMLVGDGSEALLGGAFITYVEIRDR